MSMSTQNSEKIKNKRVDKLIYKLQNGVKNSERRKQYGRT